MTSSNATIDLPPRSTSPAAVRHLTRALLSTWGLADGNIDDAVLAVHELLVNALQHAGGEANLELQLSYAEHGLRVSLADGSAIRPMVRELDRTAERGRGMRLVAALAERWGIDDYHGGKRVWLQLPVDPSPDSSR